MAGKESSNDLRDERPDDDTPMGADATASPPGAAPKSGSKGGKGKKPVQEQPEYFRKVTRAEAEAAAQEAPQGKSNVEFNDDSPLGADADAAAAMVEVERIGPGIGQGWVGDTYDGIPVSMGRVSSFPRTKRIYDDVIARAGGGQYQFTGRDPKTGKTQTVIKTFPGAPLPLPSEQQTQQAYREQAYGSMGGSSFEGGGGEDYYSRAEDFGVPADDPGASPHRSRRESGPNGWLFSAALNLWEWWENGRKTHPPRGARPPALPGSGGFTGRSPFDHSYDEDESKTVKELKKEIEELKKAKGAESVADRWFQMQEALRKEEDRKEERRERERKEEENRRREERKEEENRRREEEKERRRDEETRRREDEQRRLEAQKEAAKLAAEAAKAQAEAQKRAAELAAETAKAQAEATKEAAKYSAEAAKENNSQMMKLMLNKAEGGSVKEIMALSMQMAGMFAGVNGDKSEAERILSMVPQVLDTAIPRLAEGYAFIKNPGVLTNGSPPQIGTNGGPADPTADPDAEAITKILGAILKCLANNVPPANMPGMIAVSCETAGIPYEKVRDILLKGGPDYFVQFLDNLAKQPQMGMDVKVQIGAAKGLVSSPNGRAWIQAVQQYLVPRAQQVPPPGPAKP